MLPALWAVLRAYTPALMLPVAALVGFIGYQVESRFDRTTPAPTVGVKEMRQERHLHSPLPHDSLKDKPFVPKSVFETNMSPTLTKPVV